MPDSDVAAHARCHNLRETLLGGTASLMAFAAGPGLWEGLAHGAWNLLLDSIVLMLLGAIWLNFPLFLPYIAAFLMARYGRAVAARARLGLLPSLAILGLGGGGALGGAAAWLLLPFHSIGAGMLWGLWSAWPAVLLIWRRQRNWPLPLVRPLDAEMRRKGWIAAGTFGSLVAYVVLFVAFAQSQEGFHPFIIVMIFGHPMVLYPLAATSVLFWGAPRFARLTHWTPQLAAVSLYLLVLPLLIAPFWLPAAMDGVTKDAGAFVGLIMGSCVPAAVAAWCGLGPRNKAPSLSAEATEMSPPSHTPGVGEDLRSEDRVV